MIFRKPAVVHGAMVTSIVAASSMFVAAACSSTDGEQGATYEADAAVDAPAMPKAEAGESGDAGAAVDARPPFDPTPEPVVCATEPCAVELVAGASHFCARMSDGAVRCWGDDNWGQLGHGALGEPSPDAGDAGDAGAIPPVVQLSDVVQISAAGNLTCARSADGTVGCWGTNAMAELGIAGTRPKSDYQRHPTPTSPALGGETATRIEVGHGSVCATTTSGKLICWGNGQSQKLARSVADRGPLPVLVLPGAAELDAGAFATTTAGTRTSLGITTTREVFSWGAMSGEEGLVSGRISSRSPDIEPRKIDQLSNVTSLAVSSILWRETQGPGRPTEATPGHAHACAVTNGEVFCWGQSFTGALCTGLPDREREPRSAPVFAKAWPQQVTVGDETTCIRLTDGTVQCCGENVNGALARSTDETFSAYFTPAIEFTSHAVHVAASDGSICALVQGGTVECWGSNVHGELGTTPDREAHSSPTKITF